MAWQTADRVKETTTTTGTGTISLGGAMTGFQAFSAVCGTGDTCYYGLAAVDSNGNPTGVWEVGVGTYTSSGNTLARTVVLASSNAGSAVTLPTGTTQVWLDMPAAALAPLVSAQYNPPGGGGFVDGNFDQWNVTTSLLLSTANTDYYTADMWLVNPGSVGGYVTVSQNVRTPGSEPAYMTRPSKYQLKVVQALTTVVTVGQKLEGVNQYSGQSITVQASISSSASITGAVTGVRYTQNFGTGGSPSSTVTSTTTVSWNTSTTEAKFSALLNIPSIAGKTLGTNGNDYLRIDLILIGGGTYTMYFDQLQIDVTSPSASANTTGTGGVPLPFRYAGLALEKAKAQRYLFVRGLSSAVSLGVAYSPNTTQIWGEVPMPVPLRALPACSVTGSFTASLGGTVYTPTGSSLVAQTVDRSVLVMTVSSVTAGVSGYFQSASGGGFLINDARL